MKPNVPNCPEQIPRSSWMIFTGLSKIKLKWNLDSGSFQNAEIYSALIINKQFYSTFS